MRAASSDKFILLFHDAQQLNSRKQAVTGRVVIEENDMPRPCFPTEELAVFSHFFQDVAVADSSDFRLAAHFFQGFVEADVAHDRTDDGILFEAAFGFNFMAQRSMIWSPSMSCPFSSTARQRSASPSLAMPMSAPYFKTVSFRLSSW